MKRRPLPLERRPRSGLHSRRTPVRDCADDALAIAMLAPPWIPVPAPGYGGIEAVVDGLCQELIRVGHAVTLFAAPGSRSAAIVRPLLDRKHPDAFQHALFEADHVARAFEEIDRARELGAPFDVIHDHCGFTALAMADRCETPLVHTIHGPFTDDSRAFYEHHARKAEIVAISRAQRRMAPACLRGIRVIPNPIILDEWGFSAHKDDYLLWIGRIVEYKGPHRAIDVARAAGRPLVLAGPVQPGQEAFFAEAIEPRLEPGRCDYLGEVGGARKQRLFAAAAALLMPIRWPEPFGMVMVEALAAGTPVIAFPEGAAAEIVIDGRNGFLVADEEEMAAAIGRLGEIDPADCRASVAARYDVRTVARCYEAAYHAARDRTAAGTGTARGAASAVRGSAVAGEARRRLT